MEIGAAAASLQWASVTADLSWEQLNVGDWKDASITWREVYAVSVLLKAMCLTRAGKRIEALALVDRGILLGAPVFERALHTFAEVLTREIQTSSPSSPKQTVPSSGEGHESGTECAALSQDHSNKEAVFLGRSGENSQTGGKGKARIVFRNYNQFKASDERLHGATWTGGQPSHEALGRERKKLKMDTCSFSGEIFQAVSGELKAISDKMTEAAEMECLDDTAKVSSSGTEMHILDEHTTASRLSAYHALVTSSPRIHPSRRITTLHCPSLEEFWQRHMQPSSPAVLTGAMDHWPAYAEGKWR